MESNSSVGGILSLAVSQEFKKSIKKTAKVSFSILSIISRRVFKKTQNNLTQK
jgi:hypothetical protein